MEGVILLNNDYSYLSAISWKKAIKLIMKGKAEVVKFTDREITNFERSVVMKVPKVIKLLYFLERLFKLHAPYNRKTVYLRDGNACVYCGDTKHLTIDHVVPKAKGGKTAFDNVVACCFDCNNIKGDKLISTKIIYPTGHKLTGNRMKLTKKPYIPTMADYIRLKYDNNVEIMSMINEVNYSI